MAKNASIGFALNYQHTNLLDATPSGPDHTWVWLGPGIDTIDQSRSDKTKEREDYSTGGVTQTNITGVNKELSVSGSRLIGDPAQEYLASIEDSVGQERETTYRCIHPDGTIVDETVTIKDPSITGPSGAGSDESAISFTMSRNDSPVLVEEGGKLHLPESVEAEDVTVKVGETATVSPTVLPATASGWCLYDTEDHDVATVTADGIVKGVKVGETRLSAKCAVKPSLRAVVKVTVTEE